ncbi:MAG TPA: MFS transporter [Bryobacteraceae bacterium]|nr:MFS transporter [Bryobacteraceae bacterium]
MNRRRIFFSSCLALATTAVSFAIRGDILDALGADFHLTHEQIGVVLSPAFWGCTLSILIGGVLIDLVGMRRLFLLSSLGYIVAPALIIFAPRPSAAVTPFYSDPGFLCLYAGMLLLGLSQGFVEGTVNPLVATLNPDDKTHKLNVLHSWWPGGTILGGLAAYLITKWMGLDVPGLAAASSTLGWQVKIAVLMIPAIAYGLLMLPLKFPNTERVDAGVSSRDMFREALRPMFLLFFVCMWMTSCTELGPDQWVGPLVTNMTGMRGILILVFTSGIMFLLRNFAGGRLARRLSPLGLLTTSSVASAIGLFALSAAQTPFQAFGAATIFGFGTAFFWPTMMAVTSEQFPRGGAWLLAIMGGVGNLAVAFILPLMGGVYDTRGAAAAFRSVAILPIILTVVFSGVILYFRSKGGYTSVQLKPLEARVERAAR